MGPLEEDSSKVELSTPPKVRDHVYFSLSDVLADMDTADGLQESGDTNPGKEGTQINVETITLHDSDDEFSSSEEQPFKLTRQITLDRKLSHDVSITSYDEGDNTLNFIEGKLHRPLMLRLLYHFCPCACSVDLLEFFQLTLPGYTRHFDQISDFIVFAMFYKKFLHWSPMLLAVALLSIAIRWFVSLRTIDIESIATAGRCRSVFLFIYIIPIFGWRGCVIWRRRRVRTFETFCKRGGDL